MNLRNASGLVNNFVYRIVRLLARFRTSRRITAFGKGDGKISSILVVNLDRHPERWEKMLSEFRYFQTFNGSPLLSIVQRFSAVDARDGRASAATADVDPIYSIGDQLFVQPDAILEECFGHDEPIKMTRQEVAIARSHIEVWKTIANGSNDFVLVLEDDVWFCFGASRAIERGWKEAKRRCREQGGPHFLYFSYEDAGGTAERTDVCSAIFKPVRGLWFLSGYVLSRDGAQKLLKAMPVVGPVDTWMNYRLGELDALALASPAILQRYDCATSNSYSVMPYLARAGIIDSTSYQNVPNQLSDGSVLAWTEDHNRESLGMALSMLGLRVRVCDEWDETIDANGLLQNLKFFDVLLNASLTPCALSTAINMDEVKFILEAEPKPGSPFSIEQLPGTRTLLLGGTKVKRKPWQPLCDFLKLEVPVDNYPTGAPNEYRLFRKDRDFSPSVPMDNKLTRKVKSDDTPWVLPSNCNWQPKDIQNQVIGPLKNMTLQTDMSRTETWLRDLTETFPGSLTQFVRKSVDRTEEGTKLVFSKSNSDQKPYFSGSFASIDEIIHGRIEVEIKVASGSGLITGFFLHRSNPRQEIDLEFLGNNPTGMLTNVYFNPGDEDTSLSFGYRGSPFWIDLGFDVTKNFHLYTIDWQPDRITWSVDGRIVHERKSWDPTPIPHLPMRFYGNLWSPRAKDLAGQINEKELPAKTIFRNLSICTKKH